MKLSDLGAHRKILTMARVSLQLSDDLMGKVRSRAAEGGHGSVEEYVEALVRADVGDTDVEADDIEAVLLARINSPDPGIEVTPEYVTQFKQQIARRRQPGSGQT